MVRRRATRERGKRERGRDGERERKGGQEKDGRTRERKRENRPTPRHKAALSVSVISPGWGFSEEGQRSTEAGKGEREKGRRRKRVAHPGFSLAPPPCPTTALFICK